MNLLERNMVDLLKELKEEYHVIGIKAEFEAEGTRLEEGLRLKEVISAAGLDLTLKIGGCEAVRDMYETRIIGVSRVVAPMVESPFALKKFLEAIDKVYPEDERTQIDFAINIETVTAYQNLDAILSLPEIGKLNGIVVGRVDLSYSLGVGRDGVNSPYVSTMAEEILTKAKSKSLETAIGGGVSAQSVQVFRTWATGLLDRYETRKVIFGCPNALGSNAEKGILKAVYFELLWLKNKRNFYGMIFAEDASRIEMLESRYKDTMTELGII